MQYILLLITRFGILVPVGIILFKIARYLRKPDRDGGLEETAKGLLLINTAIFVESAFFGAYDIYKIVNHLPTSAPSWIIILWCSIQLTLVWGVWTLFSVLYERGDDSK